MEIMARSILIESREKKENIQITSILKTKIFLAIQKWLKEWAILDKKNNVVWWWKIKNIFKNPLLK